MFPVSHYVREEWPLSQGLKPGSHNVQSHPLFEPNKILLPPLHIKLGLMKNFVKAIDSKGSGFSFLQDNFSQTIMEKLKVGIFDGPQIKELMMGPMFGKVLSEAELFAWQSLKSVVTNFLGNHRCAEYEKDIEELLESFCQLGVRMSVKLHFQPSCLLFFPNNCRDLREELGKHFRWDIRIMEECCQGW